MTKITIWKNGERVSASIREFIHQLDAYAKYADDRFKHNSDPSAHLGERLRSAADLIELLMERP